jgi:hypothetical protein
MSEWSVEFGAGASAHAKGGNNSTRRCKTYLSLFMAHPMPRRTSVIGVQVKTRMKPITTTRYSGAAPGERELAETQRRSEQLIGNETSKSRRDGNGGLRPIPDRQVIDVDRKGEGQRKNAYGATIADVDDFL